MSTDLQLSPNFPKIRLPPVRIQRSPPPQAFGDGRDRDGGAAGGSNSFLLRLERCAQEEEGCRTPTSEEYRIPAPSTCPPAPRKPQRPPTCKRKLSEFEFFETIHRPEVDGFFFATALAASPATRRRCGW